MLGWASWDRTDNLRRRELKNASLKTVVLPEVGGPLRTAAAPRFME
jgi:hypothetical protein